MVEVGWRPYLSESGVRIMKMGGVFGARLKFELSICGEINRNNSLEPDCGGF